MLDAVAGALAQLGTGHSLVVAGSDGLDEVSLSAVTRVRQVRGSEVTALEWTADDFGLPPCSLQDLRAEGATESAATIERVLRGDDRAATWVVLANAAAALLAAERVTDVREGVALAREALRAGRALQVLEKLRKLNDPRPGSSTSA